MEIRIAKNNLDSKSASYIYAMSWKKAYKNIFSESLLNSIPADFWVKSFDDNYNTHRFEVAILKDKNSDLGACGYGLSRDYPEEKLGEITSIYFLEEAWGKGYAKQLLEFVINKLKDSKYKKIHIWVLEKNPRAQKCYEKVGFIKSGKSREIEFKDEKQIEIEYVLDII